MICGGASFVAEKTVEIALKDGGKRTVSGGPDFHQHRYARFSPEAGRTGYRCVSRQRFDHGTGQGSGTPDDSRRRLHRAGVCADVSALWLGGDALFIAAGSCSIAKTTDIAKEIQSIFAEDGITVHLNAMASKVSKVDDDISLTFTADNATKTIKDRTC